MNNSGGFYRLSVSFAYASGVIFCICSGLMVWEFLNFLIGVVSPEIANQSEQLTSLLLGLTLKFLLTIKLYVYALLLASFFSWLAWIFAGFASD